MGGIGDYPSDLQASTTEPRSAGRQYREL